MTDPGSGELRADILNEKILSAIVEIKTAIDQVGARRQTWALAA
jgi:hypothetical protein